MTCDVIVIGAGPAGLACAVNAASEGLRVAVAFTPGGFGGQAGTSPLIRNYPGTLAAGVAGGVLTHRMAMQAAAFGVRFLEGRVVDLRRRRRMWSVTTTAQPTSLDAPTVVLALGVVPRPFTAAGVEQFRGAGLTYGLDPENAPSSFPRPAFVVGAGNSAGQAALSLHARGAKVHLVVRGASLAASMSAYLWREIARTPGIVVRFQTEIIALRGDDHLHAVVVVDPWRGMQTLPASAVYVLVGGEPATAWLPTEIERDDAGYVVTTAGFATTAPGVFAVGDVRGGSVKRCASAVGEGSCVVPSIHRFLDDGGCRV